MNRKWIWITATALIALTVLTVLLFKFKPAEEFKTEATPEPTAMNEVKVPINGAEETPVYENVTDAETGETVPAQVQENVPPQTKPTAPPEKPKANDDYTNPDAPPAYNREQTIATQPPKKISPPQTQSSTSGKNGVSKAPEGQVYIEGFGYVTEGGNAQTQPGISDGDINKQVGNMD